ncbi:HAAS signaling domain-containing protein [Streptomyces nanshensis]|uniref:Uncharacterized protein n=1 Tax=Streptomyces nanshensis TaxID=518642 RepID=A0A1E7L6V9_9ACTN|nr:hypothetical protein [Streptomyces nanshensis]OEV11851.1 hypothetical protein AN218_11100 [Streptomyces nanshensis]
MTSRGDQLVEEYLRRFDNSSVFLAEERRAELREEIVEHIAAGTEEAEAAYAEAVRAVLDRLGPPADIVASETGTGPTPSGPGFAGPGPADGPADELTGDTAALGHDAPSAPGAFTSASFSKGDAGPPPPDLSASASRAHHRRLALLAGGGLVVVAVVGALVFGSSTTSSGPAPVVDRQSTAPTQSDTPGSEGPTETTSPPPSEKVSETPTESATETPTETASPTESPTG